MSDSRKTRINIRGMHGDNPNINIKGVIIEECYEGCAEVDDITLKKIENDKEFRGMVAIEGKDADFYWQAKPLEIDPNATLAEQYAILKDKYETIVAKEGMEIKELQDKVNELAGVSATNEDLTKKLDTANKQVESLQTQLKAATDDLAKAKNDLSVANTTNEDLTKKLDTANKDLKKAQEDLKKATEKPAK